MPLGQSNNSTMKAGEKVSSSFIMAQMFLGAKIRQISYISKFLLAINVSSTKYSYISNQKGDAIGVDNLVILHSAAHSGFRNYLPSAGVALRFTTCLWSATPSEFWLLSPIKAGVALRFTPACGLASHSGLLFSAERPIKSTILRAPQIDPEQTAPFPSLALMIRSNFGLSLV